MGEVEGGGAGGERGGGMRFGRGVGAIGGRRRLRMSVVVGLRHMIAASGEEPLSNAFHPRPNSLWHSPLRHSGFLCRGPSGMTLLCHGFHWCGRLLPWPLLAHPPMAKGSNTQLRRTVPPVYHLSSDTHFLRARRIHHKFCSGEEVFGLQQLTFIDTFFF